MFDDKNLQRMVRRQELEQTLGLKLDDCNKASLIELVLHLDFHSKTAVSLGKDLLDKDSIFKYWSEHLDEIETPDLSDAKLGLFTECLLMHLKNARPDALLTKNQSETATCLEVANLIENDPQSQEALDWLNLFVSFAIDGVAQNRLEPWDSESCASSDAIVNQDNLNLSLYVLIKMLKQNLDRVSASLFLENKSINNFSLAQHHAISSMIEKIWSLYGDFNANASGK
jgi:hypothetical protein